MRETIRTIEKMLFFGRIEILSCLETQAHNLLDAFSSLWRALGLLPTKDELQLK